MIRTRLLSCFLVSLCLFLIGADKAADFVPLFPVDGAPKGWSVRAWDDVKNDGPKGAAWKVQDGVLHGSEPRGTWLVSDKLYGDFVLDFEWKLGERGNSGCGIRFPIRAIRPSMASKCKCAMRDTTTRRTDRIS